jgi:serine/threonine protein phosphatase PrpC
MSEDNDKKSIRVSIYLPRWQHDLACLISGHTGEALSTFLRRLIIDALENNALNLLKTFQRLNEIEIISDLKPDTNLDIANQISKIIIERNQEMRKLQVDRLIESDLD